MMYVRTVCCLLATCCIACDRSRDAVHRPGTTPDSQTDTVAAKPPAIKHLYSARSGIVEIRSTMMGIRQTMYFDNYGARQATYTSAKSGDSTTSAVRIIGSGYVVEYNEQTRLGRRRADSSGDFQMPDMENLSPQTRKDFNVKELESRIYLGKPCKGYQMESMGTTSRTWVWGNISMYAEAVSPKGSFTMQVTSLQTDVPVPQEKFDIPKDVLITNYH